MKRLIAGLILVTFMLVTIACAKAPASVSVEGKGIPAPAPAPAPVINIPRPAPAPTPAPRPAPAPVPSGAVEVDESWATERMIVRTGNMQLVVADVLAAIERIAGLAGSADGYVVSSSSWREGDRLVGNIAIRVAAERFDDTVIVLRGLAVEVLSESTSSKDVTEEYVDLSAKLKNLEATEIQLLRLMEKAEKVEDILDVQRELSRTREDIERTKGRMQYLERTSATSLINVRLEQAALDVNFSASKKTVKVGQDVYFSPNIAGGISPYSYEWDFGDGNTSTDTAPNHNYKSVGSYTVSLEVTDDRGNTDIKTREAYIGVLPGWSAGNIASSAWNGFVIFGQVLADIFIWIGIFSPVWIVIIGILYLTWWRRRKKKV
ncbi:DUF4349 domain-containing protein [Chloroflexota bacterium]